MPSLKWPALVCAVLAISAALALGGCGSSSSSSNTPTVGTTHAVVGFAAHAGLAFGAFKLFIYNPYKAGKLKLRHPLTLAKAGVAALLAYHEIKKARAELNGHPTLSKLIGPFTALATAFNLLKSHLAHGDTSSVAGVQNAINSANRTSSGLHSPIKTLTSGINL
jgi:hypothetical protein